MTRLVGAILLCSAQQYATVTRPPPVNLVNVGLLLAEKLELDAVRALVIHEMEHAAELSVPLVVDVGVGRDWLETKIG